MIKWIIAILFSFSVSFPLYTDAAVFYENALFQAQRDSRFFWVKLKTPHQVLSTSQVNGGFSNQLTYLVNHQSMEANNHQQQIDLILNGGEADYHQIVAKHLNVEPKLMALMGTAAQMNNMAHRQVYFEGLTVDAFVTAGVSGNAMRAGEETRWFQTKDGNKKVDFQGTINIMVLVNRPLSDGALAKASMLLTEAKSAALSELAVSSRYSPHLATGTGTDQFIIAAPSPTQKSFVYKSASGHLKLGELVGKVVREATLDALMWQNRLAPKDTASVIYALGRFGLNQQRFLDYLHSSLPKPVYQLAEGNQVAIIENTRVVAAAYAYAAILDRFQYSTLPETMKLEILRDSAATAAVALSGDTLTWSLAWQKLSVSKDKPIDLFLNAVALGWQAKWEN